jgi:hypothetical protein
MIVLVYILFSLVVQFRAVISKKFSQFTYGVEDFLLMFSFSHNCSSKTISFMLAF